MTLIASVENLTSLGRVISQSIWPKLFRKLVARANDATAVCSTKRSTIKKERIFQKGDCRIKH